ncbi:MAG: hypothetical protein QOJ96_938 [Alphaproteobacteria bacterium]|nr:hypothetical protein [Alphaproteobacteria bacterium]
MKKAAATMTKSKTGAEGGRLPSPLWGGAGGGGGELALSQTPPRLTSFADPPHKGEGEARASLLPQHPRMLLVTHGAAAAAARARLVVRKFLARRVAVFQEIVDRRPRRAVQVHVGRA